MDNAKRKMNEIEWTDKCEETFCKLKEICSDTPILEFADYNKCFKVHTDASEQGLGAVLYQDQDDGTTRVIAYASRNLSKAEKRYHSSKLEFLVLKWNICEHFHEFLYGGKFEVYTDNNPFTYVLTSAKLDATGLHLWPTMILPSITGVANKILRLMPSPGLSGNMMMQ